MVNSSGFIEKAPRITRFQGALVRVVGVEPTRIASQEPKSCASANSAIPAFCSARNPPLFSPLIIAQFNAAVYLYFPQIKPLRLTNQISYDIISPKDRGAGWLRGSNCFDPRT